MLCHRSLSHTGSVNFGLAMMGIGFRFSVCSEIKGMGDGPDDNRKNREH